MRSISPHEAELFHVLRVTLDKVITIDPSKILSAKEAMLELHVAWERLQTCVYNRKLDGFHSVVEAMINLSSTALVMSSILQSKVKDELSRRIEVEEPTTVELIPIKKARARKKANN